MTEETKSVPLTFDDLDRLQTLANALSDPPRCFLDQESGALVAGSVAIIRAVTTTPGGKGVVITEGWAVVIDLKIHKHDGRDSALKAAVRHLLEVEMGRRLRSIQDGEDDSPHAFDQRDVIALAKLLQEGGLPGVPSILHAGLLDVLGTPYQVKVGEWDDAAPGRRVYHVGSVSRGDEVLYVGTSRGAAFGALVGELRRRKAMAWDDTPPPEVDNPGPALQRTTTAGETPS